MKNFILLLTFLVTLPSVSYEDSNCNHEAISIVSKLTGLNESSLSIMGSIRDDLTFYTFVGDTANESLVYEVKLNADSYCHLEGFYESSIYTDEFYGYEMKKISIFLNANN